MAMKEFRTNTSTIIDRSKVSVAIYLREISHMESLSADQEAELVRIIRQGGEEAISARERLINANLKFVVSVANQYKSHQLELSDLISEGNIGLIKAVNHYDETRGFKFISYAVWWIRQSIMEAVHKHNTIFRLPQNQQTIYRQFRQMQEDIFQKEQRQISVEEFCEVSGFNQSRVIRVLEGYLKPVYMDQKIAEDSDTTFADSLVSGLFSDDELERESLRHDLVEVMKTVLSGREEFVLKKFYGFDCEPMQLDEIGDEIHVSCERTRQIYHCALNKLRNSPYFSCLNMHFAA